MRKFTYSMQSYRINILRGFQNMAQNTPKSFLWIRWGYVNLDRIWWKKPRIKVHFIVFLRNYSGILEVVRVMLDIYAIVLAIHLLLNWYSFLFLLLTIATIGTWLCCRTVANGDADWFGGWLYGIGCGWLGWGWWTWRQNGGVDSSFIIIQPLQLLQTHHKNDN